MGKEGSGQESEEKVGGMHCDGTQWLCRARWSRRRKGFPKSQKLDIYQLQRPAEITRQDHDMRSKRLARLTGQSTPEQNVLSMYPRLTCHP